MHYAVLTNDGLDIGGTIKPLSSLMAVVGTDAGNVLVLQDGTAAMLAGGVDMFSLADLCPWVRCTV